MQFQVLKDFEKPNSIQPEQKTEEKLGSEKSETPTPAPEKILSYERIVGIIDTLGAKLANDPKLSLEEKIKQWVDILKWVLPLIPPDRQHFKASVKESIENPSQWDFMEKNL